MNETEIPTPRTDAEARLMSLDCDDSCVEIYIKRDGKTIEGNFVSADFARQLERENIALQAHLDELTARSIHSCGNHCQRPNCVRRREMQAMRWLIQESVLVIDQLSMAASGGSQPANAKIMAIKEGNKLLTKLKPHLP